jgi:hypothetical protein
LILLNEINALVRFQIFKKAPVLKSPSVSGTFKDVFPAPYFEMAATNGWRKGCLQVGACRIHS